MFANASGNSAATPRTTTTCLTATITLQIGTCSVALVGAVCVSVGNYVWGNGTAILGVSGTVPQFKVTTTNTSTTVSTTVTPATSTFPADERRDPVRDGHGRAPSAPAVPAICTSRARRRRRWPSSRRTTSSSPATTGAANTNTQAMMMIGQNDVRIYHPVKCRTTTASLIAQTTAGFCPNDTTGLYSTAQPDGARPDQQYTNLRTDLAG